MAHLWLKDSCGWEALKLGDKPFDLVPHLAHTKPGKPTAKCGRLISVDTGGTPAWALVLAPDAPIRVNGRSVLAGLCVLADRDAILAGGAQFFFSAESLAVIEPLPRTDRPIFCSRCQQKIEVGSPAVRCPNCGAWYCQSEALPCWTYAPTCTHCPQPTALDLGLKWTPEE